VVAFQKRAESSVQRGRHSHNSSSRQYAALLRPFCLQRSQHRTPAHSLALRSVRPAFAMLGSAIPRFPALAMATCKSTMHLFSVTCMGLINESARFARSCRQCHRFFAVNSSVFHSHPWYQPHPMPGRSYRGPPSHSWHTQRMDRQTVAFCPEPPCASVGNTWWWASPQPQCRADHCDRSGSRYAAV
jgi:hypothetical protein